VPHTNKGPPQGGAKKRGGFVLFQNFVFLFLGFFRNHNQFSEKKGGPLVVFLGVTHNKKRGVSTPTGVEKKRKKGGNRKFFLNTLRKGFCGGNRKDNPGFFSQFLTPAKQKKKKIQKNPKGGKMGGGGGGGGEMGVKGGGKKRKGMFLFPKNQKPPLFSGGGW